MDAVKFIYEARRRYRVTGQVCSVLSGWVEPESIVKELEEWSKEHPYKTRQTEYLKMFPNAKLDNDGVLFLCPVTAGGRSVCIKTNNDIPTTQTWYECRKNFWSIIKE